MVKTAVLVSGGGTNLQALIDAKTRGEIPFADICLVVSSKKDVYALERAKDAGIKTETVPRKDYDSSAAFDEELLAMLKKHDIHIVVLAGFLTILGQNIIDAFPNRILNVHPSLIPSFCGKGYYGLKVHESALEKGVKITGATVHFVNEIPDGGQIILQKAVEINDDDTANTLQERVMKEAEWVILPKALHMVSASYNDENTSQKES